MICARGARGTPSVLASLRAFTINTNQFWLKVVNGVRPCRIFFYRSLSRFLFVMPSQNNKRRSAAAGSGNSPSQSPPRSAKKSKGAASVECEKLAADGQLLCLRCTQPTTIEDSAAAGKNELRRYCNGCCATDQNITRIIKKVDKIPNPTQEDKGRCFCREADAGGAS